MSWLVNALRSNSAFRFKVWLACMILLPSCYLKLAAEARITLDEILESQNEGDRETCLLNNPPMFTYIDSWLDGSFDPTMFPCFSIVILCQITMMRRKKVTSLSDNLLTKFIVVLVDTAVFIFHNYFLYLEIHDYWCFKAQYLDTSECSDLYKEKLINLLKNKLKNIFFISFLKIK